MNQIRIILVCMTIPFFLFTAFILLKVKHHEEYQQKAVLAKEVRKVLDHLMFDLREARENTILDAPADGMWHDRIAFDRNQEGALEYVIHDGHLLRINGGKTLLIADDISNLRIRHQKDTPDILEVEIKAQKNVSLMTYLRIRIRQ